MLFYSDTVEDNLVHESIYFIFLINTNYNDLDYTMYQLNRYLLNKSYMQFTQIPVSCFNYYNIMHHISNA